jgi:ABC-type multidrug transport system ATPase subunit
MEEAEELCERVVIINDGHSIMEGNPKEIIREVIGKKVLDVVVIRGERAKFERILKKENAKRTHIENRFVILQPGGLFETIAPFCKKVTCRPPKLEDLFLVVNHEI